MNWGIKIAGLYTGFVLMMGGLVWAAFHQKFELVSADYYKDELSYQQIIDARKNQQALSAAVTLEKSSTHIIFRFPSEFAGEVLHGTVQFYSAAHASRDYATDLTIAGQESRVTIAALKPSTNYQVKLSWQGNGKTYYQESELILP